VKGEPANRLRASFRFLFSCVVFSGRGLSLWRVMPFPPNGIPDPQRWNRICNYSMFNKKNLRKHFSGIFGGDEVCPSHLKAKQPGCRKLRERTPAAPSTLNPAPKLIVPLWQASRKNEAMSLSTAPTTKYLHRHCRLNVCSPASIASPASGSGGSCSPTSVQAAAIRRSGGHRENMMYPSSAPSGTFSWSAARRSQGRYR